jgi:hypothetical protein
MDGYPTHRPIILYSRDVLQCVKELFGNPSFKGHMDYAPVTLWADVDGKERLYGETMSSGTYWNTMQVLIYVDLKCCERRIYATP